MDSALDFESKGWGFEPPAGLVLFLFCFPLFLCFSLRSLSEQPLTATPSSSSGSGSSASQQHTRLHSTRLLPPPLSATVAMESAFLLRVPHAMAEQLHRQLAEKEAANNNNKSAADEKSKEKSSGPSVKLTFFGADGSVGVQHGGGSAGSMRGQLVNLPTIIEAHKTFDNIHFYKCTDIAQVGRQHDNREREEEERRHGTARHCTALHCTALHCTALHCTALRSAAGCVGVELTAHRRCCCLLSL